MSNQITSEEWKEKFIARIISEAGFDRDTAMEEFLVWEESGLVDLDDSPDDAADEALWGY